MPKIPSETSSNKTQRRTARISVRPCCLINLTSSNESPLSDYNVAPPSTPLESPPKTTLAPQATSPIQTLTTLKFTPPSLTTLPLVPTQPSKQTPLHATDLDPLELIFSTPPTSPYPFFDTLEDLPPRSTNPPHLSSFESIKCMAKQPPLLSKIMDVKPPLPPFPPQFPQPQPFLSIDQSIWINGPSPPPIRHEHLCEHCQQTQTIAYEVQDEMQFILNHILDHLNAITYQNNFPQTLMTTLAEHTIVVGAENHPPMLEKSMYDSWASRICLFIKRKRYGRMMLDSIDNGPLVDPTVEENRQTRPMKYFELTKAQQLQDDYDVAKDIWDRVKMLMKGTELSYQERECRLYNFFDKFAYVQVQVNTKFLNALPSEWSKFINDVKLAKSLYPDSLALVANSPTLYNPSQSPQHLVTQQSQVEFPQLDSNLAVLMFQQREDPIECLNKVMAFLFVVVSRFPPSNNQLRTSCNPRNQATIQDGRVIVQQVQGRQTQSYVGTGNRGIATTSKGNFIAGQQRPKLIKRVDLDKSRLAFLADPGISEAPVDQQRNPQNSAFQTKYLDAYDSDCDDLSSAAILMANLQSCDPEVLYEDTKSLAPTIYSSSLSEQMERLDQWFLDKNSFEIQIKHLSIDTDQLLKQILSQEFVHIAVNSVDSFDVQKSGVNKCNKSLDLETELLKKKDLIEKDIYDKLLKNYSTLEKHCISLELITQLNQEVFQRDNFRENQNAHTFNQLFELNELKAQSQEKDTVIRKLKDRIKYLSGKDSLENIKKDIDEIETINIELEHNLNSQLQEKVFTITTLKNELRKLKGKHVVDIVDSKPNATIALGMFKLDIKPISPRLKNNRDAHEVYIEKTIEYTNTLCGFVERARTPNPSEPLLESTCMFTKHVQELLVYVSQTCPNSPKPSEKLVAVTPMNKEKRVRFVKPVTSSSNIPKQTDSLKTKDSNKPLFTSTGVKPTTSASGSKPLGNIKNNRITRPLSSNQKNKVNDYSRKVKSSLNKTNSIFEPVSNVLVKHSVRNAKFEPICAICNKCLFDANHDMCIINYVNDVNVRSKSKPKINKMRKVWKPTGKVFSEIRYSWKPTGRTFTIVGNICPLTRITSTKVVAPKETTIATVVTPTSGILVYSKRPKATRFVGSSSKVKIVESKTFNSKEPKQSWGSIVSDFPFVSLNDCSEMEANPYIGQVVTDTTPDEEHVSPTCPNRVVVGACLAEERLKPMLKLNVSCGMAEDRLLPHLSKHFEPSEVGLLCFVPIESKAKLRGACVFRLCRFALGGLRSKGRFWFRILQGTFSSLAASSAIGSIGPLD
ncbi:hypothetical protein Tco_0253079 [Tanacetum coccineum]